MTDFSLEFVFASGEKHSPKAEPNEWLLRSDADTVADSLTVRFSAGKRLFTEEPVGAVLKKDGAVIFDGIVDEHRVKCQNGARTEVFSLRSRAALLLDNEAAPMELRLPSLRLLERMYLMPLGLHAVGGDRRPVEGVLTIEKGVSCPKTVKPDRVTVREVVFCPYKMLSGVTVQNAQTGAYSAEYHDPLAPQVRVRYLSAYAKTAPMALLNESRRASKRLKLTCASYIDGNIGDTMRTEELGEVRLISKNVLLRGKDVKTELLFEPV